MEKSSSQRVSQAGGRISLRSSNPHMTEKVRAILKEFDVNQDEALDIEEVSTLVDHLVKKEMKYKYLKYAFGGLMGFTLLLLGSMFGLTWAVVESLKDTRLDTSGTMMTKDGSKVVQVASSDYAVVNGSLISRNHNQSESTSDPWPIRTTSYLGSPYSLYDQTITMKSLLEMNVVNLRLANGDEASFRVQGVTKAMNGAVNILTERGFITVHPNGTMVFDPTLENYLETVFPTSSLVGRRRLFSSEDTKLNGFFNSMEDDGSWWRVEANSKSDAKARSGKLRGVANNNGDIARAWANYKQHYGKRYDRQDDQMRFDTFKENMLKVLEINEDDSVSWWASGNEFSDMSWDEFRSSFMMQQPPVIRTDTEQQEEQEFDNDGSLERRRQLLQVQTIDWRQSGKVGPVRNQGGCGGCWAFAAASVLESAHAIIKGLSSPVDLSEQHLINCQTSNCFGCTSGSTWDAIQWAISRNITYESRYPFTAATGTCGNVNYAAADTIKFKGFVGQVTSNSATSLRTAVARQPVATYMMVDQSFMNYAGGIYTSTSCTLNVNHAMVIVGFDVPTSHWIIRNSWGSTWGESGYARVAMAADGTPGTCGMYQYNFFPPLALATPAPPPLPRSPPPQKSG